MNLIIPNMSIETAEHKVKAKLHLGIIPDGNRRYARAKSLPLIEGYITGIERLYAILFLLGESGTELSIKTVTVYICSVDNLTKRAPSEVDTLYELFQLQFEKHLSNTSPVHRYGIKINFIGDLTKLPDNLACLAQKLEQATAKYDSYIVNLAMGYDGRQEIIDAANAAAVNAAVTSGSNIASGFNLNVDGIVKHLKVPDFDLVIRTGGEYRTSNFFPWQTVYSEWFFMKKMWPDFTIEDLRSIIKQFKQRDRRFGK